MAVPEVSKASKPTVFSAAGFKDINNNGVIDKLDKYGRPAGENYTEDADFDGDGKIVVAEAKFYLWYILRSDKAKQFPITDSDKTVLLGLFKKAVANTRTIKDLGERSYKVNNIARWMADVGLFEEAAEVALPIEKLDFRWPALSYIALKAADAGLFEKAVAIARLIKDPGIKSATLGDIVIRMVKAGRFIDGREIARTIENSWDKSPAFLEIVKGMANAGLFKDALETAREIENSSDNSEALRYVLSKMQETKMRNKEIKKLFKDTRNNMP